MRAEGLEVVKFRWDQPEAGGGGRRGDLRKALASLGDPMQAAQAAKKFRCMALAVTTKLVYDCHIRTLVLLAKTGGFELFPRTGDKVFAIGGALKEAGYRSITGYFMRYRKEHVARWG